jgi:hypothetical protein
VSFDVRVEAATRRVVAGEHVWSFELDCRSGGATVVLDGSPVRVRPLHWREKVVLARFAGLGSELVEEQFLRLALAQDEPPTGAARAALVALALWLNAPDAEALPLQPTLLASVTLDVCSAIGLAPADLDDRDALEVESLWRAAADSRLTAARHADSPSDGAQAGAHVEAGNTTRIVIVPDPAREKEGDAPADAGLEPQAERREPPEPIATSDPAVGQNDDPAPVETASKTPARSPAPAAAEARGRGRRGTPWSRKAAVQRFLPLTAGDIAASPAGVILTRPRPVEPSGFDSVVRDEATATRAPAPVSSAAPSRSPEQHVSRALSRSDTSELRGRPGRAARSGRPSLRDRATDPWPLPAPVASTLLDTDDLLEELSERLARAAGELGVLEL